MGNGCLETAATASMVCTDRHWNRQRLVRQSCDERFKAAFPTSELGSVDQFRIGLLGRAGQDSKFNILLSALHP